jgi:hypothetical protein
MQSQEMIAGGRYQSGSQAALAFGANKSEASALEIRWRSGKVSRIENVEANRLYEIAETGAAPEKTHEPLPESKPLFKNVSPLLQHQHTDEAFNDFERQPLLLRRLSQLGPGVTWFDFNGDGFDDIAIDSGKGGQIALYLNDGKGGFSRQTNEALATVMTRDTTTALGWRDKNGKPVMIIGCANYEDGLTNSSAVREFHAAEKTLIESIPATDSSSGALAMADIDADGNLDLFVAGRVIAGHYPEAASSRLFKGDGLKWTLDVENSKTLENVGLVTGAVWTDLDADGFPDLVLACEWGPVRVFKNQNGKLHESTRELGLEKFTGLWNGIAAADLDGDGRMDLIVGNWGLNSSYRASPQKPLEIFWGAFSQPGRVDVLETEYDEASHKLVPLRRLNTLANAIPSLRERFPTHLAFASATIDQIFPPGSLSNRLTVMTLASTIFFNRGNHFEAEELPLEAQLSPAFGIVAADFDGDGNQDLFISQNFFGSQPEVARLDAGRGLLLQNTGQGKFRPVSASESGIYIYGEQRGAAAGDIDNDGRIDLLVGQNGAATQLFHNEQSKPCLRVTLRLGDGNHSAVGASVRARGGNTIGPAIEVHAGSGYWSQDSSTIFMAAAAALEELEIRWPGGKKTITRIPQGATACDIDSTGKLLSR